VCSNIYNQLGQRPSLREGFTHNTTYTRCMPQHSQATKSMNMECLFFMFITSLHEPISESTQSLLYIISYVVYIYSWIIMNSHMRKKKWNMCLSISYIYMSCSHLAKASNQSLTKRHLTVQGFSIMAGGKGKDKARKTAAAKDVVAVMKRLSKDEKMRLLHSEDVSACLEYCSIC